MGEKIGDRYFEGEKCPLCVRWHCLDCGHPYTQTTKVMTAPAVKVCSSCRSTHGEYRVVIHRDETVTKSHRAIYEAQNAVLPFDRERIRDLQALIDFLTPMVRSYHAQWRQALRTATESTENNAAINASNKILLNLDDLVRHWVKDHPLDGYHGPEPE